MRNILIIIIILILLCVLLLFYLYDRWLQFDIMDKIDTNMSCIDKAITKSDIRLEYMKILIHTRLNQQILDLNREMLANNLKLFKICH
jgi:hypothetical protein